MATAHSLSVLTNASVKPPINPKNQLPNTFHERIKTETFWDVPEVEVQASTLEDTLPRDRKPEERQSKSFSLSPRDPLIEELTEDIEYLDDDQFYERLQHLKKEHQKTLSLCKDLYTQKTEAQGGRNISLSNSAHDQIRDMSRPPKPLGVKVVQGSKRAWESKGYDSNMFKRVTDSSADEADESEITRERTQQVSQSLGRSAQKSAVNNSFSSSMDKIEGMWDGFSVEEYYTGEKSPSEASSRTQMSNKENVEKTWSPKITIPQPFNMMLREAQKTKKKQTKAQQEVEHLQREKEIQDEIECQRKFKASPAPAHIYVPLYDEIQEVQESKRQANHRNRAEMLRSTEKPFNFMQREEHKDRYRQRTSTDVTEQQLTKMKVKQNSFRARPVPKTVEDNVLERLAEEEEYRKIRKRIRAVELLRESRLPPSMEAREMIGEREEKVHQMAEKVKKMGINTEPTFKPKIRRSVPDFETAHRKMQYELSLSKSMKEPTVAEPFNLHTARIPSNKDRIKADMERDEESLPENRWPYKNPRTKPKNISKNPRTKPTNISQISLPADQIPAHTNSSTLLRQSQTREKLYERRLREEAERETIRRKGKRRDGLNKSIGEKAAANQVLYNLQDSRVQEKLSRFKEEERERKRAYRNMLKDIDNKLKDRPLLFEQATQAAAREKAERKYQSTLKQAGVSDRVFESRRSTSRSPSRSPHRSPSPYDRDSFTAVGRGKWESDEEGRGSARSFRESVRSRSSVGSKTYSYSQQFSKEETGLSDGDLSDAESIKSEVLEAA